MILLDTDVLIEILQKDSERGKQAIEIIEDDGNPQTTVISVHELLYGLYKREIQTPDLLLKLTVIPFTKQDSILSSQLEYRAETRGQKTHRLDSMNAAIAINNKTQFLTFNQRHYQTFTEDGLALLNI